MRDDKRKSCWTTAQQKGTNVLFFSFATFESHDEKRQRLYAVISMEQIADQNVPPNKCGSNQCDDETETEW